jgi:hypothetical protein
MLQYPHRMRLRGPWECAPLAAAPGQALPPPRRVIMPCTWAEARLAGRVVRARFTRRFGYPGRIDEHERVWLIGERLEGTADIAVNGQELARGHTGPFAFDVTSMLGARNQLDVIIETERDDGGLSGDVALEIRCSAYLERMTASRGEAGAVVITGAVVGNADGPLEIYVLADGRHVHYQKVEPGAAGNPLHMIIERCDPPVEHIRVELINVATVWYAWETTLS